MLSRRSDYSLHICDTLWRHLSALTIGAFLRASFALAQFATTELDFVIVKAQLTDVVRSSVGVTPLLVVTVPHVAPLSRMSRTKKRQGSPEMLLVGPPRV